MSIGSSRSARCCPLWLSACRGSADRSHSLSAGPTDTIWFMSATGEAREIAAPIAPHQGLDRGFLLDRKRAEGKVAFFC